MPLNTSLYGKTTSGEISVVNAILALLVSKPAENDLIGAKANIKQNQVEDEVINKSIVLLLDEMDLMGLRNWSLEDQKEFLGLILEYTSILAMHNMDPDKPSVT